MIAVHGSAELGASLADAGLVDRYHLLEFPVLLGAGKRLFSSTDKDATKLDLVEHETYANGIQMKVYDVVHPEGLRPLGATRWQRPPHSTPPNQRRHVPHTRRQSRHRVHVPSLPLGHLGRVVRFDLIADARKHP